MKSKIVKIKRRNKKDMTSNVSKYDLESSLNNYFMCSNCNMSFPRKKRLTRHVLKCKDILPFACPVCKRKFSRKNSLGYHMTMSHFKPIPQKQPKVHLQSNAENQKNPKNGDSSSSSPSKAYRCITCNKVFISLKQLNIHILNFHRNGKSEPLYLSKQINETWVERVMDTENFVKIKRTGLNTLTIQTCSKPELLDQENIDTVPPKPVKMVKCKICSKKMRYTSMFRHMKHIHNVVKKKRFRKAHKLNVS